MKKLPLVLTLALLAAVYATGNAYLINLFVVCAIYALPAIGLSLLVGHCGQISLGHAAFVGIGAYAAAIASQRWDMDPWLAVLFAAALACAAAWAVGKLVFRLRGHHLAMATLALGMIVHTVLVEWHDVTGGPDGISVAGVLKVGSLELASDPAFFVLGWLAVIVALILADNLIRSPFGLALRVVGESELVAGSIGIAPARVKQLIMMASGALAGLSGGLYTFWMGYISPDPFNVALSIKLLLIVALSGFTGTWRTLVGVFFVVLVSEGMKSFGHLDVILYGLLLILTMLFPVQRLGNALRHLLARRANRAKAPVIKANVL